MCFNIVTLDMFLIFNFRLMYYLNTFLNMENAKNKENNTTNPKNNLLTTVELCKLCVHNI